jgi:hypothetical protein
MGIWLKARKLIDDSNQLNDKNLPMMVRKIPTTVSTSCDNSTTGRDDGDEPSSSMTSVECKINNNTNLNDKLLFV